MSKPQSCTLKGARYDGSMTNFSKSIFTILSFSLGCVIAEAHPVLPLKIETETYINDKVSSRGTIWIQDETHSRTETIVDMTSTMAASKAYVGAQTNNAMAQKMMNDMMAGMAKMPKTSKSYRLTNPSGIYSWSENNPRKTITKMDDPQLVASHAGAIDAYWGDFSALEKAGFKPVKTGSEVVEGKNCDRYRIDITDKADPRLSTVIKDAVLWTNKADGSPVKSQVTMTGVVAGMGKPYTLYKSYEKHAAMPAGAFDLPQGYTIVSHMEQQKEQQKRLDEMQEKLKNLPHAPAKK